MMQDLAAISKTIATPNSTLLGKVMLNDYQATSTVAYSRNASDSKITYIPSENTQIYGKYGITPYTDSSIRRSWVTHLARAATPARAVPRLTAASRAMSAAAARTPGSASAMCSARTW